MEGWVGISSFVGLGVSVVYVCGDVLGSMRRECLTAVWEYWVWGNALGNSLHVGSVCEPVCVVVRLRDCVTRAKQRGLCGGLCVCIRLSACMGAITEGLFEGGCLLGGGDHV